MKRYATLILAGLVVLLAVDAHRRAGFPEEPASGAAGLRARSFPSLRWNPILKQWGINFPNQFTTFEKTATNNIETTYGGSSQFSWLERDPRQVILFAGYPFSKDYNDDRGHANALEDVRATGRLNLNPDDPKHTPATCYSCKSSNNPGLWDNMGMEAYDKMSFVEMTPNIQETIGCANCHEAGTMRLIVTNPALEEALKAQGKDWTTFTRQEMRTVVCANCHVEYYFKGDGKYLTFPWAQGTDIDSILAYYEAASFKDWDYPGHRHAHAQGPAPRV